MITQDLNSPLQCTLRALNFCEILQLGETLIGFFKSFFDILYFSFGKAVGYENNS